MLRPFTCFVVVVIAAALLLPAVGSQAQVGSGVDLQSAQRRLMPIPGPRPPGPGWVWVPPVYRTVWERVWREGAYRPVNETVWVPDQYGWRTVCYWDGTQYVERQEWGVTVPAHYEMRSRQEWVPGRWEWVERRELVTPGHWEWRGMGPSPRPDPVPPDHRPAPRPPGLEPFSPLWEWPQEKK